jgi:hypothetical protein
MYGSKFSGFQPTVSIWRKVSRVAFGTFRRTVRTERKRVFWSEVMPVSSRAEKMYSKNSTDRVEEPSCRGLIFAV